MASRNIHPSGRPQHKKSRERVGEAFSVYRPVSEESADELFEVLADLRSDNEIPSTAVIRPAHSMRITYIEKHRLTKQLKGYAAGFDARGAVDRVTAGDSMEEPLPVSLGRVGLMDRRDETVVARISHSQEIAEEYGFIVAGLAVANIPGLRKGSFKPHISLVHIPGLSLDEKTNIADRIQTCLPEEVMLSPITSDPRNPGQKRR